MIDSTQVIDAIKRAFDTNDVVPHLREKEGRVFGSVEVKGSVKFDNLDDIRRQRLFWDQLRSAMGAAQSIAVGPVTLEPTNTWTFHRDG